MSLIDLQIQRLKNRIKKAHFIPGNTKATVPFARNFDYIGDTFYHGPMSQWKSVDDYRKKAKPPVEIWRTDKEENKKYRERRIGEDSLKKRDKRKTKKKRKGLKPIQRARRRNALNVILYKIAKADRPFFYSKVSEIKEIADKNWNDRAKLGEVEKELALRGSKAAKDLHEVVRKRLQDLSGESFEEPVEIEKEVPEKAIEPTKERRSIVYNYSGNGVDIKLKSKTSPEGVCWTSLNNSYVLVNPADLEFEGLWDLPGVGRVDLVCIHLNGEIRWSVRPMLVGFVPDAKEAVGFFGLTPAKK